MNPSIDAGVEIRVPRETVNDDTVTIQRWLFAAGERVRAQAVVAVIETSKAALDIEAPIDGFLEIIKPDGSEVGIGDLIGRVASEPARIVPAERATPPAAQNATANGSQGISISKKAQAMLDQNGIDGAVFAGRGMVRESDVVQYLKERETGTSIGLLGSDQPLPAAAPALTIPGSAAIEPPNTDFLNDLQSPGILGDAKQSALDRGRSTPWLIWNYFWRNWLLGNLVPFAPRGVILQLHKWRGVKMGRGCFIDPTAVLETAYPENITIGNDVRITVRCIIMTHIKAPDYLRQSGIMPVVLKPVRLEDHCFIGVNSVIMPGVTIGRASVVTSGSVVLADVPPFSMVSGNPAKVIKRFPTTRVSSAPTALPATTGNAIRD